MVKWYTHPHLAPTAVYSSHHQQLPPRCGELNSLLQYGNHHHHHHHHQKAFRNKSHTSHGQRPGLKRNKTKTKIRVDRYFAARSARGLVPKCIIIVIIIKLLSNVHKNGYAKNKQIYITCRSCAGSTHHSSRPASQATRQADRQPRPPLPPPLLCIPQNCGARSTSCTRNAHTYERIKYELWRTQHVMHTQCAHL